MKSLEDAIDLGRMAIHLAFLQLGCGLISLRFLG
jgi:hypothetical protein